MRLWDRDTAVCGIVVEDSPIRWCNCYFEHRWAEERQHTLVHRLDMEVNVFHFEEVEAHPSRGRDVFLLETCPVHVRFDGCRGRRRWLWWLMKIGVFTCDFIG